jgi:uroporphyrinogen-III synthase
LPDAAVLITRPEPGASETAARVAALGWQPVVAPLLVIQSRQVHAPRSLQAILVTSGNAIAALPASHRALPLLAVGDATAARARAAGFTRVESAAGDADALAALAVRRCDPVGAPLLLASGQGQGGELATTLRASRFRVLRRVAYAAEPVRALPQAMREALSSGAVHAALFFSAETARTAVRLLRRARLHDAVRNVDALAIGGPAAVALEALRWRCIRVAEQPNQDAMLALLR